MPFFGREDRTSPTPEGDAATPSPAADPTSSAPRSTPSRSRTVIAAGLQITGQVTGDDPVQVDGTVDGEIRVDGPVVLGPEGHVKGRIQAREVTVHGRLDGNLAASERAEVTTGGKVEGDIEAPRVVIAEGAYFKGNIKMGATPGGSGNREAAS